MCFFIFGMAAWKAVVPVWYGIREFFRVGAFFFMVVLLFYLFAVCGGSCHVFYLLCAGISIASRGWTSDWMKCVLDEEHRHVRG